MPTIRSRPCCPRSVSTDTRADSAPRACPSADALTLAQSHIWWRLLEAAHHLARQEGIDIDREGYFLTTNAGRHDESRYPHLHLCSGALQ